MPNFFRCVKKLSTLVAFIALLFLASTARAEPAYEVSRRSFADANGNGSIDCGELMTLQLAVFDLDPPRDTDITGRITFPSDFPSRWSFLKGTVQQDFTFSAGCLSEIVRGNGSNDGGAIIDYTCRLPSSSPNSQGYALTILLQGFYSGPSGSIRIPSENQVLSPAPVLLDDLFIDNRVTGCASPDLTLTKSDGGVSATRGQTLAYTLSYRNNGSATATSTTLNETVPAHTTFNAAASSPGWSCSPSSAAGSVCSLVHGNLVVGGSGSKTFAVDVAPSTPASASSLTNTATVSSALTDSNPANNTATETTPLAAGAPDLAVSKTLTSSSATPGSVVTFTVTVRNAGNGWAQNVVATDTVPAHSTFDSAASSPGWTCSGSSCSASLGDLAPGVSVSRIFAARIVHPLPAQAATLTNTACASTPTSGDPQGNNCATASTPINASPNLVLTKTLSSGTATPGGVVRYQLALTNAGNQAAEGIVLTETVPVHTTLSAAASDPAWVCASPAAGSSCSLTIASLDGGGATTARTFGVTTVNPLPANAASIRNTACVGTTCSTVEMPTDGSPRLSVSKVPVAGSAVPGEVLTYRIDLQNTGNQAASGVSLRETVPQNTRFNAGASDSSWSCTSPAAGSSCTLFLGEVPAGGAPLGRLFAVRIDSPLPAGTTTIANTVCASRSGATDVCSTQPTPSGGSPRLSISKSLTGGSPEPGALLTYTLTVSNTGNQGAASVTLSDVLPPDTAFSPANSSPGWSCSPNNNAGSRCTLVLASLPAGATEERQLALILSDPFPAASISNTACAATGSDISVCSTDTHPLSGAPELHLTKSYSGPPLAPGALLPFTLTVANSGTRSATGIRLTETVPAATSFDADHSDPNWSCSSPAAGASCSLLLPSLAAGAETSVVFAVRAANPLPPGLLQISNTACLTTVSGDAIRCGDTSTPLVTFVEVTLTDALAQDANANGSLDLNDVLRYTLTLTNPSTGSASNLTLTTAIDSHLALIPSSVSTTAGTIATGSSPGDSNVTLTLASLAPGATVTLTFEVLARDLQGLRAVSSQALVRGTNFEDEPSDDPETRDLDDDPTVTPLDGQPIAAIPTLGTLGLTGLILALAGLAAQRLRRQRAH